MHSQDVSLQCITNDPTVNNTLLNFRITEDQHSALREIAKKNGVSVSQLARWAVEALIQQVEANDGRLSLPIEFSKSGTGKKAR